MRRRTFVIAFSSMLAGCAPKAWQQAKLSSSAYDDETHDYGLAPTTATRKSDFDAPTPIRITGATTITTPQLRGMMLKSPPPILIDVIGGHPTTTIPGAIWLHGAGLGHDLHDEVQTRLAARLSELTGGDKSKTVVFFCLSKTCWLSHNAAVRAVAMGYSDVYWYRGGRDAWRAAGLPMMAIPPSKF